MKRRNQRTNSLYTGFDLSVWSDVVKLYPFNLMLGEWRWKHIAQKNFQSYWKQIHCWKNYFWGPIGIYLLEFSNTQVE